MAPKDWWIQHKLLLMTIHTIVFFPNFAGCKSNPTNSICPSLVQVYIAYIVVLISLIFQYVIMYHELCEHFRAIIFKLKPFCQLWYDVIWSHLWLKLVDHDSCLVYTSIHVLCRIMLLVCSGMTPDDKWHQWQCNYSIIWQWPDKLVVPNSAFISN